MNCDVKEDEKDDLGRGIGVIGVPDSTSQGKAVGF